MSLILTISVSTCTTSIFVQLERFALRKPSFSAVPYWLRFLATKNLFCCFVPKKLHLKKDDEFSGSRNRKVTAKLSDGIDEGIRGLVPSANDFEDQHNQSAREITAGNIILEATVQQLTPLDDHRLDSKLDLVIALNRELLEIRRELRHKGQLPGHWDRIISRLEYCSLIFYLGIIALNVCMFLWPIWY